MNLKVVFLSLVGIAFVILSFAIDWLFIIGAAVVMFINQKELNKGNKNSSGNGSGRDSNSDSGGD
ncbi:MAG: hypothetical protein ABEI74_00920 [Candidatus Pacearchaeota archaeon]